MEEHRNTFKIFIFKPIVLGENGEDKMVRKVTNVQVFERIGEQRALLNNILRINVYLIVTF